jgi:hypothetical protein
MSIEQIRLTAAVDSISVPHTQLCELIITCNGGNRYDDRIEFVRPLHSLEKANDQRNASKWQQHLVR